MLPRGAGWQAQTAEGLDDERRIFNRGDDLEGTATVGAVIDVDSKSRLSSRAQLIRGDVLCA